MDKPNELENKKAAFLRVEQILSEKKIRPPDFQKELGIQSQHWNNWKTRGLPSKEHIKISALLEINSNWLATGEGEKYRNGYENFMLDEELCVPVTGAAQLRDNGHWHELECHLVHGDGYINFSVLDKGAYALRCVGDSMKPRIRNGELVIVEPHREAQPGDDVVLKSLDGKVMVKTYLYKRDGRVHLMSINEAHPPQFIAFEEVDKIHPIIAIANNLAR